MPWLILIVFFIIAVPIFYAVWSSIFSTVGGKIAASFLVLLFASIISFFIWAISYKIASCCGASYYLNDKEVVEINRCYILDDTVIIETSDGETIEEYYLDNHISIKCSESSCEYAYIYRNCTWKSSVRQFLYGDAPKYIELYLNN